MTLYVGTYIPILLCFQLIDFNLFRQYLPKTISTCSHRNCLKKIVNRNIFRNKDYFY